MSPNPTRGGIEPHDRDFLSETHSEFTRTFLSSVHFHFQQIAFTFLGLSRREFFLMPSQNPVTAALG